MKSKLVNWANKEYGRSMNKNILPDLLAPFVLAAAVFFNAALSLAQEEKPAQSKSGDRSSAEQPAESKPAQKKQLDLSPEYMRLVGESALLFQQEKFEESIERLNRADAIQINTPIALNMRGAIATETGHYDEARDYFKKALIDFPDYFAPNFNLGEILFLEKRYAEAREHFQKMLDKTPDNELLQYKIFLSYLLEGDSDAARKAKEAIKFPSDTPAYYFANAAWEFNRKNDQDARTWIDSSLRIFGDQANLFFLRSLKDIGFVEKSEYVLDFGEDSKSGVDRGGSLERAAGARAVEGSATGSASKLKDE